MNPKKNVLIDLDDSVFDFKPSHAKSINQYIKGFLGIDLNLQPKHMVQYRVSKTLPLVEKGITSADIHNSLRYLSNTPEFTNLPLIEGFYEFYRLVTNNFKDIDRFFFVTSRSDVFYDDHITKTKKNLESRGIRFNDNNLVFRYDKENFSRENNIECTIEDNLEILYNMNNHIYKIINNQPWNHMTDLDKSNLSEEDYNRKVELVNAIDSCDRNLRIDNYKIFLNS